MTPTDIITLSALHLAATVGPDHWHRTRPQPIHLTLHLHLTPSYLTTAGHSDNVTDSLHYGHLTKAVETRVHERTGGYPSPRALINDVTDAAFAFVRDAPDEVIHAVRVVLQLPKQILLAEGFEVELTTRASDWAPPSGGSGSTAGAIVRVTDLVLPVLVGVNPPERLAKQRVITHLTFSEASSRTSIEVIETSTHLTLEKLVYDILHTAYRASDAQNAFRMDAITVRCQKPSALSFADASGVEMTRTREAFQLVGEMNP
ncbi:tetrahydrobiopterin biosynthesis enzymes-like protein [Butyriboletus roseoflavus]|nr:tetrahydrobiopterin biosynthesis enzymes-like protein [Butyriboletus roseoflavus]